MKEGLTNSKSVMNVLNIIISSRRCGRGWDRLLWHAVPQLLQPGHSGLLHPRCPWPAHCGLISGKLYFFTIFFYYLYFFHQTYPGAMMGPGQAPPPGGPGASSDYSHAPPSSSSTSLVSGPPSSSAVCIYFLYDYFC